MRLDAFVGLPSVDLAIAEGRPYEGRDCWAFYAHVSLVAFGREVPSFSNRYQNAADVRAILSIVAHERPLWELIDADDAKIGDGVFIIDQPYHVGIVAGRGLMLHMPRGGSSVIEPYRTGRWTVEGIYRFREAART